MRHQRFLKYVDEIARAGSVRKAADRLNVTPSALNRRLIDIERELGVSLFERHARGMRLNAAGEAFVRYVREQASSLARIRSEIEDLSGFRRGAVKLAVSQTVAQDLLPRAIQRYRASFPLVEFHVRVCNREIAMKMLTDYAVDLVMVLGPETWNECETLAVATQQVIAFMATDHPLAAKKSLRMRDIVDYPLALPEPSLSSRTLLDGFFARSSLTPRIAVETNSFELLKSFVAVENAVAFQVRVGTAERHADQGVVARPIAEPGLDSVNLVLGQLRGRTLPVSAAKFAQDIARILDEMR